jgi:hypothetical protein
MKTLAALLLLLSVSASAHCPVPFVITGPGGLAWQISIDGDLYDGMLPGGKPSALGAMTTWVDTRRLGPTTGVVPVNMTVTDGSRFARCPTVGLNLSGPPRCSEDYDAPGEVPQPVCVPYFTIVRTAPGVFSCASACQPGTAPAAAFYPASSTPPSLSGLSPAARSASSAPLALTVSGSGFNGAAVVQWNGTPLATYFVGTGSLVALVPGSLLGSPGGASVTVAIPGSASSALSFTVTP